jgi:hypothetical protein
MAHAVAPGATRWVGVVGGVDTGPFHAASERLVRDRFFAERRAHGDLQLRVVATRGFGAHRRARAVRVTAR